MKKFFLFYTLIGCLFTSSPLLAMPEREDEEHKTWLHQQTIGNSDIVHLIIEFLDDSDFVRAHSVSHTWEEGALKDYPRRLEANKTKVLEFFEGRSYCEKLIPTISGITI